MATQFEIDCALMAGRSYQDTRKKINWLPVPEGWTEFYHVPNDTYHTSSGFEAAEIGNFIFGVRSFFEPSLAACRRIATVRQAES